MRLTWMTDIHFNFCGTQQIEAFLIQVIKEEPEVIVISGDIGEAHSLVDYLARIVNTLEIPIYFVLGNHDYYHSNVANVRRVIKRACEVEPNLNHLNLLDAVSLTEGVALVGHDGWADGRYGDFFRSGVILNDYVMIQNLAQADNKTELLHQLHLLGDEAAAHLQRVLPDALANNKQVFVVLHPPPFQETVWHQGKTPDDTDDYLPHFACKAVGDVLLALVPEYPDCAVTVLCGHTHGAGDVKIRPNLRVITGGAVYRNPQIQQTFDF